MFCCKGKRLANFLLDNGCRLVRIDCDQINKNYLVFLFEKTDCLEMSLKKWDIEKNTYLV